MWTPTAADASSALEPPEPGLVRDRQHLGVARSVAVAWKMLGANDNSTIMRTMHRRPYLHRHLGRHFTKSTSIDNR